MEHDAFACKRGSVLGVMVSCIDYSGAVEAIATAAWLGRPFAVTALAVHGVMTGVLDPAHRPRLNSFDLVVPDGQPVRWALNLLHGAHLRDRVYGPTLMARVCERFARDGLPIGLYGSKPETIARLRANLSARYPGLKIPFAQPSVFRRLTHGERSALCAAIGQSGVRLLFVGLGCPRQEVWVYEYREALRIPLVAVGAAFDFHAGTLAQAPAVLQRMGLEWLFRLCVEPRRLWRRYALLNPLYVVLLGLQAAGLLRIDTDASCQPSSMENYG